MSVAAVYLPSHPFCHYRPGPVRASFGQWHRYAHFYPFAEQQNKWYLHATSSQVGFGVPLPKRFAKPRRNDSVQIPIARLLTLTVLVYPAVSSFEACQTPAH